MTFDLIREILSIFFRDYFKENMNKEPIHSRTTRPTQVFINDYIYAYCVEWRDDNRGEMKKLI